ncbi:phytanoyl-CoA dioxygenase family protein [Phenylobacterium sp. LjRoot225]|uniref:phytanoyl-CoA dioxygenase family protein n=1 Tax=Phenylobacterium sp. LjRoot225 TaxID=3342285 RepID=UPI003ED16267
MAPLVHTSPDRFQLQADGAQLFPAALDEAALATLRAILADQPADLAGVRLFEVEGLRPFLDPSGPVGAIATSTMAGPPQPVRAILFDKTPATNWSLAWRQDRVIAVRGRVDLEGFGPWTRKHGALHVAPPFEILSSMTTLRVHLDPVPESNAPLLIAPGSHRLGRIAETDVPAAVERCGVAWFIAACGDVWLYATPIVHASERASEPMRRRVLQVDYACGSLPGGLEWLGV